MRTYCFFFFSSRRRHTRLQGDWSSDVCSSDLGDGWHATSKSPAELAASLDRLRAMADAARRPFETIALSIRVALRHALTADARQAVVDQLSAYKALGLTHVMLDFRRDSLGEMLEILELGAKEIRPAVDRV